MALMGLSLNPIDWITDAAGEIVDGAAGAFIDVVVGWVEEALTWATQQIALVLTDLSAPDFGSSAFQQLGGTFKWLALVSLVATIMRMRRRCEAAVAMTNTSATSAPANSGQGSLRSLTMFHRMMTKINAANQAKMRRR